MTKATFDEGFSLELVQTAFFDGALEIPKIDPLKEIVIPTAMIPFSKRNRSEDFSECLVFYEHDINFAEVTRTPEAFIKDFLRFPAMVTTDNSLYRDAPLLVQIANVYRSRAIGHFFQKHGANVIPNVRWGDERSYTTNVLPEKFAFLESWFPVSWSPKDIRRAGEHVASLKKNRHIPDGEAAFGNYKGVRVGIKRTNGRVATVFPDKDQNPVLRRRKKKK